MTDLTPQESQDLVVFVRNRLGCGCPDEVFSHIEVEQRCGSSGGSSMDLFIRIGGRLLVGVVFDSRWNGQLGRQIQGILMDGMKIRDSEGFNRFRLVLVARHHPVDPPSGELPLAHLEHLDEKVHVHVVDSTDVPVFLTKNRLHRL